MGAGTKRLTNIDVVRGIAASLVVFEHAFERTFPEGAVPRFLVESINFGQMGVIAFFLVSGFVIPMSLEKSGDVRWFLVNRMLRIYPLYLTVFVLSCLLLFGAPTPKALIAQLGFASEYLHTKNFVANSWTLSVEAIWYAVFAGLFLAGRNRSTWLVAALTASTIFASSAVCLAGHHLPMGRICMLATCVFGLFAYRAFAEQKGRAVVLPSALVLSAILIGLWIGFGVEKYTGKVELTLSGVLISWSAGYVLFAGSFFLRPPAFLQTTLQGLGEISYSLYLVHILALYLMRWLGLTGSVYIAAVFLFSLAISVVTYNFIELPAIRLGHHWARRNRKTAATTLANVTL